VTMMAAVVIPLNRGVRWPQRPSLLHSITTTKGARDDRGMLFYLFNWFFTTNWLFTGYSFVQWRQRRCNMSWQQVLEMRCVSSPRWYVIVVLQ
jgi:hypothetical protein